MSVNIVFCDFPQANRLVLHIISSIAEYEADLISVRIRQALAAKKQRGATLGKPESLMNNSWQPYRAVVRPTGKKLWITSTTSGRRRSS